MIELSVDDFARIRIESSDWDREQRGGAVLFEVDRNYNAIQVGWCHAMGYANGPDSPVTSPYAWALGAFALTDSGALWQIKGTDLPPAYKYWRFVGESVE